MKSEIPIIKTTSLALCPLDPEDSSTLHQIYQSEGVLQYFPNPVPPPLEKVQRFVDGQTAHWQMYGYGNWGIKVGGGNEIVGWAGLQYVPELDETEVGFLLGRPYWGKGYATEAASASLRFGFVQNHLDHIIALVHPENIASQRVIEKCGLKYTEMITLWGIDLLCYRTEKTAFFE
jgi:RimJ/RimL family protein N-acetyltransferase